MQLYHFLHTYVTRCGALLITLAFLGCQDDPGNEKTIEEIRTEGKISSIIRSPVSANSPADTINVAQLSFEELIHDFGEVAEGDVVKHSFRFTNTGKVPLIINDAHSTCGCTIPEWPKNPIPPGGKGQIDVEFNTKNKSNNQEKPVIISANTYPSVTKVFVKGFVKPAAG